MADVIVQYCAKFLRGLANDDRFPGIIAQSREVLWQARGVEFAHLFREGKHTGL
jgi:hypothetical protein